MFSTLVFVVSLLGICALWYRYGKAEAAFVPLLSISSCILLLFLSALMGCLAILTHVLLWAGVLFFLFFLIADRHAFAYWKHPGFLFFLIFSLGIAIVGFGKTPDQYDNYTHWALIMKDLYETDALPSSGSLVTFINYPPAAGLWGYYILKCLRYGEDIMIAAQGMLVSAALSTLFAGISIQSRRRIPGIVGIIAVMCCVIPDNLMNLYVDALLGYLSVAVLVITYDSIRQERFCPCYISFVSSVLILLKPSALLLVVFCISFAILRVFGCYHNLLRKKRFLYTLLFTGFIPIGFYVLFLVHLRNSFPIVQKVQFDISLSGAAAGLTAKSADFLPAFSSLFLTAFFDFSKPIIGIFWLSLLTFVAVLLIRKQKSVSARYPVPVCFAPLSLLFYIGGLYIMYVCWLSESESMILASFPRYLGTGILFLIGCSFLLFSKSEDTQPVRSRGLSVLLILSCLLCLHLGCHPSGEGSESPRIRMSAREEVLSIAQSMNVLLPDFADSDTILYCIDDRIDAGYYYYVVRYAFMRRYVWAMQHESIEKDVMGADSEDCLILLLHWNEATENYLKQSFNESEFTPGLYQKNGNSLMLCYSLSELTQKNDQFP